MVKLNLHDDFAACIDGLVAVTLRRRNSTKEVAIHAAMRMQSETQESEPSDGAVVQSDAIWHLEMPSAEQAPQPGDVLIDQQQNQWTLLEVQLLSSLGRWKCRSRELRIAYHCQELIDIERAVWDDLGSGPEIVDWKLICAALPVSIQLVEMSLDSTSLPPSKQMIYDIVLSETIPLEPDDRLTAEDGTSYRLLDLQQAERIDALPIAKVVREENS